MSAAAAAMAADFSAALHPELSAALDELETLDGRDPAVLLAALRAVAAAAGNDSALLAATRVAAMERLKGAIGARQASTMANLVFGERVPPKPDTPARALAGSLIEYDDPEPADQPVDLGELLDGLLAFVRAHVHLDQYAAVAIALWVLHSYLADCVRRTPYLGVTSPLKRCGKSTLLDVLALLVYRAQPAANATPAVLFRLLALYRPTLLLDEADRWIAGKDASPDLLALVNAGHSVGTPALRTVGDDHEPAAFHVYGPKVIAGIGNLPDTIADRCILIPMRRKPRGVHVKRITRANEALADELRRRIVRWVADYRDRVAAIDLDAVELPDRLNDRARDCWEPLAAIAQFGGDGWVHAANDAALHLSSDHGDPDEVGTRLLRDMRRVFAQREKMLSVQVCQALADLGEDAAPWATWHRQGRDADARRIQPEDLARLLRPFGIAPHTVRLGSQTARGYRLADLADALDRYVGDALESDGDEDGDDD